MQDPTRDEMIEFLRENYSSAWEEIETDAEAAIYWYAERNHGGQWSNLYSALSCSPFNPGPVATLERADGMERELFADLCSKFGGAA